MKWKEAKKIKRECENSTLCFNCKHVNKNDLTCKFNYKIKSKDIPILWTKKDFKKEKKMSKKESNPTPPQPTIYFVEENKKYLITMDKWFYAPDGNSYIAAWGKISFFQDDILGIETNRHSTNWYIKIGEGENSVIAAGCQIHYAVECKNKPSSKRSTNWSGDAKDYNEYKTPSVIWFTE